LDGKRYLIVTADDFGIGPATSQAILELAARRLITGTVLLVNSPHSELAVRAWRQLGAALELGWHPCLTLDTPVLHVDKVRSLVGPDGRFHSLGQFIRRSLLKRLRTSEIQAELHAQFCRFLDLVGRPPTLVNSHHHVQVFSPVGEILCEILSQRRPLPFVRRIREPWRALIHVPGARRKRLVLSLLGWRDRRRQRKLGFLGNDWLAGITDPPWVADPRFLSRWLSKILGNVVELAQPATANCSVAFTSSSCSTTRAFKRRAARQGSLSSLHRSWRNSAAADRSEPPEVIDLRSGGFQPPSPGT